VILKKEGVGLYRGLLAWGRSKSGEKVVHSEVNNFQV